MRQRSGDHQVPGNAPGGHSDSVTHQMTVLLHKISQRAGRPVHEDVEELRALLASSSSSRSARQDR
jgi:hypothetical protein